MPDKDPLSSRREFDVYMEQTKLLIKLQFEHTSKSIDRMADAVTTLASQLEASKMGHVRHQEKQRATDNHIARLEQLQLRAAERLELLEKAVQRNSDMRTVVIWVTGTVFTGLIALGVALYSQSPILDTPKAILHSQTQPNKE